MLDLSAEFQHFMDDFIRELGDIDKCAEAVDRFRETLRSWQADAARDMQTLMSCIPQTRGKIVDLAPMVRKWNPPAIHRR